jgi:glucokinase
MGTGESQRHQKFSRESSRDPLLTLSSLSRTNAVSTLQSSTAVQAPRLAFSVDLGGTNLRAALIDNRGRIHFRLRQDTPQNPNNQDDIVSALIAAARECETQAERMGGIDAGCVVVPGAVDSLNRTVVKVPNLPALDQFPLRSVLEERLGWQVLLENDANAAAIGEMWQGGGRGFRKIICLTLGTGVGGGIILDGKLWRGADGSAGEIGHASVEPHGGVPCKCGNEGCLEVYASATGIKRMAIDARSRFPQSTVFSGEEVRAIDVYQAGLAGDQLALDVFESMGSYLGIALANLVNILNPELIVIGGGVANGWKLFEAPMRQEILKRAFAGPAARVKIVPAECGDDAGLLGAARLAFQSGEVDTIAG